MQRWVFRAWLVVIAVVVWSLHSCNADAQVAYAPQGYRATWVAPVQYTYVRGPWFPGKRLGRGLRAAAGRPVGPIYRPVYLAPAPY